MAIEDLDLEFEEEEEEKKGDGAIDQGVELDFSTAPEDETQPAQSADVTPIAPARKQKLAKEAAAKGPRTKTAPGQSNNSQANVSQIVTQATRQATQAAIQAATEVATQTAYQVATQAAQLAAQQSSELLGKQLAAELSKTITEQIQKEVSKIQLGPGQASETGSGPPADIKLAVQEEKTEFIVDYVSEARVMEHKINQILLKIHAKNPSFQREILGIKKMLNDHVTKYKKTKK